MARSAVVFAAVKWVGVAYLAYLGGHAWWSTRRDGGPAGSPAAGSGPGGHWPLLREEFLVAAVNPKAIVLFAVLLPQFVRGPGPVTPGLLAVGVAYVVVEAVTGVVYCVVGSRLRRPGSSAARDRLVHRLTGTCLLGLAVYLGVVAHQVA